MNGQNNVLSTRVHALSGPLFEQFACQWLQISSDVPLLGGQLIQAQPFARSGQAQDGVDVQADIVRNVDGREKRVRAVFQCKRTRDWDARKTREAIQALSDPADECVLVLAKDTGGGGDGPIQRVINQHNRTKPEGFPHWHVFFISDIERHLRQTLKNDRGIRLVSQYFGPETAHELFERSLPSPLISESALTGGFRDSFSHSQDLLGRDAELTSLLEALNGEHQALVVPAPGGEGKTRLLIELARRSAEGAVRRCVRFLEPCTPTELEEGLQWLPVSEQYVIILDDAHKWQTDFHAHFDNLRARLGGRLRLVIGTRPYFVSAVRVELNQAKIPALRVFPSLNRLAQPDLRKLATKALKPELGDLAKPLLDASCGSPLIVLVGAKHLNKHDGKVNLHGSEDFRREVLDGIFDTPKLAKEHGSSRRTVEEVLDLLALLSSASIDESLEGKAAEFVGMTMPDYRRLLDVLEEAGCLQIRRDVSGSQRTWRLVPDLAADYRACAACFDGSGKVRDFPGRFWKALGSDAILQTVLRNLSEAEYIARLLHPAAPRVTTPLVDALKSEYRAAGWRRRVGILDTWKQVCELQPHESLAQVREALRLRNDQPAEVPDIMEETFSTAPPSFDQVRECCADIAEAVGKTHLDLVTLALDLLWELDGGDYGDLLAKVSSICSAAVAVDPIVAKQAMPWIKARLHDPQHLPSGERLGGLLHAMLDGCFRLNFTETEWADARTIQFHSYLPPLRRSKDLRQEALEICLNWLRSDLLHARLAAAHFIRNFFVPHTMPVKAEGARAEDRKAWRREQARACHALTKAIPDIADPATLWTLRTTLITSLESALHEKSGRHCIHELLETVPDSFDLRVHRLFLSAEHNNSPISEEECRRRALYQAGKEPGFQESIDSIRDENALRRQAWIDFVDQTTLEILRHSRDEDGLWRFLHETRRNIESVGSINYWAFISSVSRQQPELLEPLAEHLFESDDADLDGLFHALEHTWGEEPETRSRWTLRALRSPRRTLVLEALLSLRYRSDITESELRMLREHASSDDALLREGVIRWATEVHLRSSDWENTFGVLAAVEFETHEGSLIEALSDALTYWLDPLHPGTIPQGAEILRKFTEIPDLHKYRLTELLGSWSRREPSQVLDFLEARFGLWQQNMDAGYEPFGHLDLHSLDDVPGLGRRIDSAFKELLRMHANGDSRSEQPCASWFRILAEGAWKTFKEWLDRRLDGFEQKEFMLALPPLSSHSSVPFNDPDLTEKILLKAGQLGSHCLEMARLWLRQSLIPPMFEARHGEAREHDLHNREKALELAARHCLRPVLHAFYLEIVQGSERAIKRAEEEPSPWPDQMAE